MSQPTPHPHQEGLPFHDGEYKVSLLFLITTGHASVNGNAVVVPKNSGFIAFSDRPHRVAKHMAGGMNAYIEIFINSDFETDPPNLTFCGTAEDGSEALMVFETAEPEDAGDNVHIPIVAVNGDLDLVLSGEYTNVSLVVDDLWGAITGGIETVAAGVGTVAAGVGALAACTVGEVATAGADTPVCVAAVAGTIAAGTGTGVLATNAVHEAVTG